MKIFIIAVEAQGVKVRYFTDNTCNMYLWRTEER